MLPFLSQLPASEKLEMSATNSYDLLPDQLMPSVISSSTWSYLRINVTNTYWNISSAIKLPLNIPDEVAACIRAFVHHGADAPEYRVVDGKWKATRRGLEE